MADRLAEELSIAAFFNEAERAIQSVQTRADKLLAAYANLSQKAPKLFAVEEIGYNGHRRALIEEIDSLLPHLPMDALQIRDAEERPRIVPFRLTAGTLEFNLSIRRRISGPEQIVAWASSMPEELQAPFSPMIDRLFASLATLDTRKDWYLLSEGLTVSTSFAGLLPKITRARTLNAIPYFDKQNLFLITEASTWRKAGKLWFETVAPLTVIVAGWDSRLRVVDVFVPVAHQKIADGEFSV